MHQNATEWWVRMNKAQPFRQHQITRALKAAAAAGVPDPSVQVHCPDGTVFTIGSKSDKAQSVKSAKVSSRNSRPTR